jgi:ribosomal protein S18 acetylase RimI-like enzyme
MNIRPATGADRSALEELVHAYLDEHWARPYPPPPPGPYLDEGQLVVAEVDGEVVGMAKGELREGLGHVSLVYLRPESRGQGGGRDLLQELAASFREQGVEHVSLNVELPNDEALAYWRRLGFTDYRRSLLTDLASLEQRLAGGEAPSTGSVHVHTDDQAAVEKAVSRFAPRVARTAATVVSAAENGWIGVYDEVAGQEPERLRKLASELSYVTGGVVLALGIERGSVVRMIAFERGQMMDEYLSVPEFYGALPPGDAMALRANPTLLGRLTGANAPAIRAAAVSASSPAELPPPDVIAAELAEAIGIPGVGLVFEEAKGRTGAVTVTHE